MKKIIIGLAIAVMSVTAQAAYLYWQVDSSDFAGHLSTTEEVIGANVYYSNAENLVYGEGTFLTRGEVGFGSPFQIDVGSLGEGYSFYIELIGYDSKVYGEGTGVVGQSEWATYTSLADAGSITTSLDIPSILVWHGTAYSAPEPTSGLLLMMGLALLSLKRRKE